MGGRPISTALLGQIAMMGIGAFIIIILLLHALETEFSPRHRMVSEYALGDYGLLLNAAALALAVGSAALALGLRKALKSTPLLPAVLVGIWASGAVTAGLFNTDPEGATETTTTGAIHTIAVAVAVLALIVGTFLFGRCFQRDGTWRSMAVATHWWVLVMLASTVATVLTWESEVGGIVQRAWLAVLVGWLFFVASHLRAVALETYKRHEE
jgi:Protein of unknown function (DUF998)